MTDLSSKTKTVKILSKKSSKSGNSYNVLEVTFSNGYVFETFLNQEQLFILNSLVNH